MKRRKRQRVGKRRPANARHAQVHAKYRRVAPLVLYWQNNQLIFDSFAMQRKITADPVVCSILQFCGEWRSVGELESHFSQYRPASLRQVLRQLHAKGLLERYGDKPDSRMTRMEGWKAWNPAAGFFHFSTKDADFSEDPWQSFRALQRLAKWNPIPAPCKTYRNAPRISLPKSDADSEFARVLKARRTWRKYSRDALPLQALAAILELTFGIQDWAELPGIGRAAMKTSPSGGALHPIEAYVVTCRVQGLASGIYHYNSKNHSVEWMRRGINREELQRNLGHQRWFAGTAFVVLMTAVFGRTQWKYDHPRVYRSILLEAGHLCQTFCLTATWQGLAPWCTIALADAKWESLLGIDGVSESLIYAAGAGMKPGDETGAHIGKLSRVMRGRKRPRATV